MPSRYSSEDHLLVQLWRYFLQRKLELASIGVALPTKRLNGTQCVPLKTPRFRDDLSQKRTSGAIR